jgi:hypothetical protein
MDFFLYKFGSRQEWKQSCGKEDFADLTKGVGINVSHPTATDDFKDLRLGRIIILNWKLKEMKCQSAERSRVP